MPAQPPPIPPVSEQNFDLAHIPNEDDRVDFHVRPKSCAPGQMGEIVVCVQRREKNRLDTPNGNFPEKTGLPKAQLNLGEGKTLGATMESGSMGPGVVSNRLMVKGTIKF
ncbi:hypothetical protein [Novosphingobium sp.]|uniref:hypothetical protein n=1 Tax=Novosphingobium sp. TaxID=1874826 RepID=UPI0031D2CBEA